jgi:hypothetical protein
MLVVNSIEPPINSSVFFIVYSFCENTLKSVLYEKKNILPETVGGHISITFIA